MEKNCRISENCKFLFYEEWLSHGIGWGIMTPHELHDNEPIFQNSSIGDEKKIHWK